MIRLDPYRAPADVAYWAARAGAVSVQSGRVDPTADVAEDPRPDAWARLAHAAHGHDTAVTR